MSTLKTNKVESTTTGGDCIVKATNTLGHKNLIINGAMQVNQYGTSSTTASSRVCDRFRVGWGGADEAITYSQHALTSSDTGPWAKGFRNSLHVQNGNQTSGLGATDYLTINYRAEAQDIVCSGWDYTSASSYITYSCWVKSSVAQNFYFIITTDDGTAYNYPVETGSLTADTWTKLKYTIPGNSNLTINNDNGKGLEFDLQLARGTDYTGSVTLNQWAAFNNSTGTPDMTSTWWTTNDATFEITGVQLEVGEVATDFEHRSYGDELARCQRYYFRKGGTQWAHALMGIMASTTQCRGYIQFPVTMRAAPSMSGSGMYVDSETTSSQDVTAFIDTHVLKDGGQIRLTTNTAGFGAGTTVNVGLNATTAYLAADAEL